MPKTMTPEQRAQDERFTRIKEWVGAQDVSDLDWVILLAARRLDDRIDDGSFIASFVHARRAFAHKVEAHWHEMRAVLARGPGR